MMMHLNALNHVLVASLIAKNPNPALMLLAVHPTSPLLSPVMLQHYQRAPPIADLLLVMRLVASNNAIPLLIAQVMKAAI
jgi:hypothetical protein